MDKPDPKSCVDDALEAAPPDRRPGKMDNCPELAAAIVYFLDLKAAGDARAHVSLKWLYDHKLREAFHAPSFDTIRRFVRDTLRRSIVTGKVIR